MDHQNIVTIGRRTAPLALAGSALLTTSGCYAIQAMIARLAGDDSFDEGGAPGSEDSDPHLSRNDRRRAPESESAASQDSEPPPNDHADEYGF